jgi:hypothetical protein
MIKTGVFRDCPISRELQVIRETIGYPIGNIKAGFSPDRIVCWNYSVGELSGWAGILSAS